MQLKPEVQPVVHAARKVTVAVREKVKAELDRMEKFKVISKVDEPTTWVNSMVVVPKPNEAVRICLDPRNLNKAIKREYYKMITLEEVTSRLLGAQYFTVLDATSGFRATPLSKESSILTMVGIAIYECLSGFGPLRRCFRRSWTVLSKDFLACTL